MTSHVDDDDKRVLRDGESLSVTLFAMDAAQREMTAHALLTDAHGNPAGYAPGYVFAAAGLKAAGRNDARDAYAAYEARLTDAWRNAHPTRRTASTPLAADGLSDAYAAYDARLVNRWRTG
jgi:hypothetical protein